MSLSALLERVEGATGETAALFLAIAEATVPGYRADLEWRERFNSFVHTGAWESAALALIGRVLPGWAWKLTGEIDVSDVPHIDGRPAASVIDASGRPWVAHAPTPALALCAALLAAMIGEEAKPSPPSTVTP